MLAHTSKCWFSVFLIPLLIACTPYKSSTWKDKSIHRRTINKVMVICINDSTIHPRKEIENDIVFALKEVGVDAVAALDEFGEGNLSNMEQEETYLQLCDHGIDAVLVITVLDAKNKEELKKSSSDYTSLHFYHRIWTYKLLAERAEINPNDEIPKKLLAETILFNLSTLSPIYWAQRKNFDASSIKPVMEKFMSSVIADVVKLKAINLQQIKLSPARAF